MLAGDPLIQALPAVDAWSARLKRIRKELQSALKDKPKVSEVSAGTPRDKSVQAPPKCVVAARRLGFIDKFNGQALQSKDFDDFFEHGRAIVYKSGSAAEVVKTLSTMGAWVKMERWVEKHLKDVSMHVAVHICIRMVFVCVCMCCELRVSSAL